MGRSKKKAIKDTLAEISRIEYRISSYIEVRKAVQNPDTDADIFIVASYLNIGMFAAQISDNALDLLKSIVVEDLIRQERTERTTLEAARTSYHLLTGKRTPPL